MSTLAGHSAVVIRLALGILFMTAASAKWRAKSDLEQALSTLGLSAHAPHAARWLPICELALGVWLLSGWRAIEAVATSICIFTIFTVALRELAKRGYAGGCPCFGATSRRLDGRASFVRNAVLIAGGLLALAVSAKEPIDTPVWEASTTTIASLVAVCSVAWIVNSLTTSMSLWRSDITEASHE